MLRKALGSTGLKVSMIGAGTAPLGGALVSDEAAVETIRRWLEHGVNYIDSSPNYGDGEAERKLGLALANVPRDSYVLQSKCGDEGPQNGGHSPFSREGVVASCKHSLQVMGVPYLDALLLHDPYKDELETFLQEGGGMEGVRELRDLGLIRHFGLGCREHAPHIALSQALGAEFQISICVDDNNLLRRYMDQEGLRSTLREADVAIVTAGVLYRGLLTDAPNIYGTDIFAEAHPELINLATSMAEFAKDKGRPLFDFAVSDTVSSTVMSSSIFGCTSAAQVDGVVAAALNPVPLEVMDEFADKFAEHVERLVPQEHFFWFKTQQAHNVEWPEMAVYPRKIWGHALNDTNTP